MAEPDRGDTRDWERRKLFLKLDGLLNAATPGVVAENPIRTCLTPLRSAC
jgi:hypothetical protein